VAKTRRIPASSLHRPAPSHVIAPLAEQLSRTMAAFHARGWCDGTGGNFSCLLAREPLRLLMAPSGVDKGSVAPNELIEVDGEGQVVAGRGRASAETRLHLEIVARTGAEAVLHTHSQAATVLSDWCLNPDRKSAALSLHDLEMLKGLEGVATHHTRVRVPVLANDQDLVRLSRAAGPLLRGAPHGLLIGGHGLYAWGQSLPQAQRHLEILEWLLEQRWRRLLLQGLGLLPPPDREVTTIVLDIEGTTCPVDFVTRELFPYARHRLDAFLTTHGHDPAVAALIGAIDEARMQTDPAAAVAAMEAIVPRDTHRDRVQFLQDLIDRDRKLPALKELQGMIWAEGYASGELKAPLFDDVGPALRQWHLSHLRLAVYSSGSVQAQQLLYGHSEAGDLRSLFSHWFDTKIGAKDDPASYRAMATTMAVPPASVLFVSDALAELEAAKAAGMRTLFSVRPGNPKQDAAAFEVITSLEQIEP
jgi:2,3-diketo-5-methylthio-1-phosphopentane phosphatase/methylthioribulose-1-phosphate dehydratase